MKKIFTILIICISFSASGICQDLKSQKLNGCIIERMPSETNSKDSLIYIEAQFQKNFINIKITNSQKNNIIINWDESAIIQDGKNCTIMFAPPSMETNNAPKGTTTIRPSTYAEKLIFPSSSLGKNGFLPIFSKSTIKKEGPKILEFILYITFNDTKTEYKVKYKISIE